MSFGPQFVVGLGQGGIIAAVIRWQLAVELTLQARNLERKEARAAGSAWAGIIGVWCVRLWRSQVGHAEVAEACPEMNKPFVEPPLRGYGIMGKVTLGDEVLKVLRLGGARSIEDAAIRSMLDEPSREVWDHDGVCACGKKTYLFSRCPNCIQAEALETAGVSPG